MSRRRRLEVLVFGAGTGTLATEIAASRLLAPYYGSSTIVWANLIGLVLLALSLGYWVGGRVADRRPDPRLLGQLVVASGLLVAVIPFAARPILDVAAEGLDELSAGAVVGSFFATLFLFAPPVFLLGMVSPFAIRLAVEDVATAGQTAGRLYALSTAGSLVGTFLPALVTIPLVGTQRTMLASAAVLVLASAALVAALPFVTEPILDLAAEGLDEISAGAVIGSFFATLLLFA
ncbi:MAG TPA: fused MFS/spermidine synthase, partial [Gaiellaceae bacterium]|nr:fused MFS/spermidine synthase [Gaiellaceae bacterium]